MEIPEWKLSGPSAGPELCAVLASRIRPGAELILLFDEDGTLDITFPVPLGVPLPSVVDSVTQVADQGWSLVIVSNRTGEVPADRPGDELVYEEVRGAALARGVQLLDWYVIWDTKAFSVAEFAPSGPGWKALGKRDAHT